MKYAMMINAESRELFSFDQIEGTRTENGKKQNVIVCILKHYCYTIAK